MYVDKGVHIFLTSMHKKYVYRCAQVEDVFNDTYKAENIHINHMIKRLLPFLL